MERPVNPTEEQTVNPEDYAYLMPWDRRPAALRAFVAWHKREPDGEKDAGWINGYIACIEDLPS